MATTTPGKKRILINGFDMFTPSHLSFGQWKRPEDRSKTKQSDLSYWTDLAKLLEKGDVTALFLADTYAQHDVYKGDDATAFSTRVACQYPVGDPIVPVSAMAAVTKRLGFAITNSTSYEAPFLLAKRMSTIDHLSGGRFGWNIVTSYKESAAKAVGAVCFCFCVCFCCLLSVCCQGCASLTARLACLLSSMTRDMKSPTSIQRFCTSESASSSASSSAVTVY